MKTITVLTLAFLPSTLVTVGQQVTPCLRSVPSKYPAQVLPCMLTYHSRYGLQTYFNSTPPRTGRCMLA